MNQINIMPLRIAQLVEMLLQKCYAITDITLEDFVLHCIHAELTGAMTNDKKKRQHTLVYSVFNRQYHIKWG